MHSRWSDGLIGVALVACLAFAYQGLARLDRPHNDFVNHRETGRRFLAGEFLYADGLNVPYLPSWGLIQSPLARIDLRTGYRVQCVLACAAVVLLLFVIHDLSRRNCPLDLKTRCLLTAIVLLAFSRQIVRDLQDGGPNLLLTALVWAALWAGSWTGGGLLGMAIALKLTPAMFLPWLACRRHVPFVLAAVVAAAAFTLLPAAWQGPASYQTHLGHWCDTVFSGLNQPDPAVGVLGPEEARNIALRPTLGRLLRAGLTAGAANVLVKLAMAGLLAASLWRLRGCHDTLHAGSALAVQALLLSPITWNQHAIAALPGFFLLTRSALMRGGIGQAATLLLVAFFLRNPPSFVLLGEGVARQLEGCGLATGGLLLLFTALLATAPYQAAAAGRIASSTASSTTPTAIASM